MARVKGKTVNQLLYKKEIQRLQRAIKRGEKQGYIFEENIIPEMPKRVTQKSLEKIKNIKPKDLYKRAEYVNQETGEVVPAEIRKSEIKKEAQIKRKETLKQKKLQTDNYYPTANVFDEILEAISSIPNPQQIWSGARRTPIDYDVTNQKNYLVNIMMNKRNIYDSQYDEYLESNREIIMEAINKVSEGYYAEQIEQSFGEIGRLLNMSALSMEDAIELSTLGESYGVTN